eukprot:TRINITY_DN4506_c0_g1_i1.p1 TRINITY_DN4506_c0_g1~~TRINITY_DN4506_c0_g1_i1.p1  ORF type:complete len:783 (-),score=176.01 TRINITY_DN4506_c0_g1_i1:636-2984(-)
MSKSSTEVQKTLFDYAGELSNAVLVVWKPGIETVFQNFNCFWQKIPSKVMRMCVFISAEQAKKVCEHPPMVRGEKLIVISAINLMAIQKALSLQRKQEFGEIITVAKESIEFGSKCVLYRYLHKLKMTSESQLGNFASASFDKCEFDKFERDIKVLKALEQVFWDEPSLSDVRLYVSDDLGEQKETAQQKPMELSSNSLYSQAWAFARIGDWQSASIHFSHILKVHRHESLMLDGVKVDIRLLNQDTLSRAKEACGNMLVMNPHFAEARVLYDILAKSKPEVIFKLAPLEPSDHTFVPKFVLNMTSHDLESIMNQESELINSIKDGKSLEEIQRLIEGRSMAYLAREDRWGYSALVAALQRNDLDIINAVLDALDDDYCNLRDRNGTSVLMNVASICQRVDVLERIVEHAPHYWRELCDGYNSTILHYACGLRHTQCSAEVLQFILLRLPTAFRQHKNGGGRNCLHVAMEQVKPNPKIIALLLKDIRKAIRRAKENQGWNPLMCGCSVPQFDGAECVKLLIDGVSASYRATRDRTGRTALYMAVVAEAKEDVIKALLKDLPTPTRQMVGDGLRQTPLMKAAMGSNNVVPLLLEDMPPEYRSMQDKENNTALLYAVLSRNSHSSDKIKALMDGMPGEYASIQNNDGLNPLIAAIAQKYKPEDIGIMVKDMNDEMLGKTMSTGATALDTLLHSAFWVSDEEKIRVQEVFDLIIERCDIWQRCMSETTFNDVSRFSLMKSLGTNFFLNKKLYLHIKKCLWLFSQQECRKFYRPEDIIWGTMMFMI